LLFDFDFSNGRQVKGKDFFHANAVGYFSDRNGAAGFFTVFFSDIASFTTISEKLGPEQLVEKLEPKPPSEFCAFLRYVCALSRVEETSGRPRANVKA